MSTELLEKATDVAALWTTTSTTHPSPLASPSQAHPSASLSASSSFAILLSRSMAVLSRVLSRSAAAPSRSGTFSGQSGTAGPGSHADGSVAGSRTSLFGAGRAGAATAAGAAWRTWFRFRTPVGLSSDSGLRSGLGSDSDSGLLADLVPDSGASNLSEPPGSGRECEVPGTANCIPEHISNI